MQNITYTATQINDIVQLLNTINIIGIDNCNKVVSIYSILNNGSKVGSNISNNNISNVTDDNV